MKIKKIQIKNFKSIEDITLEDIPPLMVLVGPNGSGKSNFVDALKFIGMVNKYGLANTLKDENLSFYPDNIKNLNLPDNEGDKIKFNFLILNEKDNSENKIQDFSYPITLSKPLDFDFWIMEEKGKEMYETLRKYERDYKKLDDFSDKYKDMPEEQIEYLERDRYLSELDLFIKKISEQSFENMISNIKVFRIDPFVIKSRSSLNNNPDFLNESGSNIAAVLEKLEKDELLREEIIDWLSFIVPELENIKINSNRLDGSKGLVFQEKSGQQFPAHMISDGTIYTLCMLVAVLTRTQKPGMTIIEEPERGLHPKAVYELISLMREQARPDHPIILTTHSEAIVRAAELNEIYLVNKENGATKIKDIRNKRINKKEIPLDTAWLTNLFNGGLPW